MKTSTNKLNQAIERMSSGYKVNHAKDNAANYSISTNMSTKIGAYEVAYSNTMMGLDMVMTASDTLAQMQDKGERLRALAIQAKNGTYGTQSLAAINSESKALISEIQRLYSSAEYNGVKLFDENPEKPVAKAEYNGFIENPYTYTAEEVAAMKKMDEFTSGASGEFKISSADDLAQLATLTNGGADTSNATFVLENDIDLTEWQNEHSGSWVAIGRNTKTFKGTFDGNGRVIKNLKINNTLDYQGLFGFTNSDSLIKNIGVINAEIVASDCVGLLVGRTIGSVVNSYSTGTITGGGYIGGLAGDVNVDIISCYSTACVNSLYADTYGYVGGLSGCARSQVSNCFATGNIMSENLCTGGLIGISAGANIINSYALGNITGNIDKIANVGGLVGISNSLVIDSYAKGNVSGNRYVGGLIGKMKSSASVQNSHSSGEVTGKGYVGDFIGINEGTNNISNCTVFQGTVGAVSGADHEGVKVLEGAPKTALQVGINAGKSSRIEFGTKFGFDITQLIYGIENDSSLGVIDDFISLMSDKATELGATQNRLESAQDEISTQYENLVSSRSTIRDADMAELSSTYVQQQILQQAAATLMSTANQSPAIALQLI